MINVRELNLDKLNSATKYPSILTYHALGKKGRLTDEVQVPFGPGEQVYFSEKVDGTNTRIIMFSSGESLVGSRNDLLWYSEDLLYNPAQSIVDVVKPLFLPNKFRVPDEGLVRVYFGESYGGKITGQSKQYSKSGSTGFRVFDIIEMDEEALLHTLDMPVEAIAAWRENGGQSFLPSKVLPRYCGNLELTPRLEFEGDLPTDHQEVLDWMESLLPKTQCQLDETGLGEPEGIIVRNNDRSRIAKIRYQDYRRTLHVRQKRR